jgi:LemA protein
MDINFAIILLALIVALLAVAVNIAVSIVRASRIIEKRLKKIQAAEEGIYAAALIRYGALKALLEPVRERVGYVKDSTLNEINMSPGMSAGERLAAERAMRDFEKEMEILARSYPALKDCPEFAELMIYASDADERLQAVKRAYNSNVSALHNMLVLFPSNIIAKVKNIKEPTD